MWGFARVFGALFRDRSFTGAVTVACVALYVLGLLLDPLAALRPRGPLDLLSPSGRALDLLGMTGWFAWSRGRWWTVLTAIYLHGGLLHILFNVLWIRQLGPAVQELYGPGRLVIIFTASGALGSVASILFGVPFTVGASGAIFGLLGAMVAFGRNRGGTFGALVFRQYGQWALALFVLGFFMPGVNNFGHAGGFVGGYLSGLLFSFEDRRAESVFDHLLAVGLIVSTVGAFALSVWSAFARV